MVLQEKLLGDWENLDFLNDFWNVVHDEKDVLQHQRLAAVWRLRNRGVSFKGIADEISIDERKAYALVSGLNLHPYLAQMYLNHQMLKTPRNGWKWILETTPKPTVPYPNAVEVPEQIATYADIANFLKQFPPLTDDNQAIRFFGLTVEWVETHKAELFGFLLGFLVGDAGKYYSEYETRARHYRKAAFTTNMKRADSNYRVLRYVQLAMDCIGIQSHEIEAQQLPNGYKVIRRNSVSSNLITWILKACLGLKKGERTSHNPVDMNWLFDSPNEWIVAFLQGLADSDGYVSEERPFAEIASTQNAQFIAGLIRGLDLEAVTYPINEEPKVVRIPATAAATIPLFNAIVKSYRYDKLQAKLRHT